MIIQFILIEVEKYIVKCIKVFNNNDCILIIIFIIITLIVIFG